MFLRSPAVRHGGSQSAGSQLDHEPKECDVIVTKDHDYYVWKGSCIAVRSRASGRFVRQDHGMGIASLHRGRAPRSSTMSRDTTMQELPRAGEWLCLERGGVLHYVGPVLGCEKRRAPQRRIVASALRRALAD
jgi:hypothetical protein